MTIPEPKRSKNQGLTRQLGLFDATMVIMGIVIGSGIFMTTGIMAKSIPAPGLILLAWTVGGLLILAGGLTFAELGASMPEAGGPYVYLREAFGSLFGFLFGWIVFLVYMTGGIAALAVAFAEFVSSFIPSLSPQNLIFSVRIPALHYSLSAGQIVAVAAILLFSAFNYFGLGLGKTIQNVLTVTKIGAIVLFIILGLTIGNGSSIDFTFVPKIPGWSLGRLFFGFGLALIAVSWAFDGWNNINFIAGEIKNPGRTLPSALILGTLSITLLYVLTNVVYFRALPVDEITGVVRIAEKTSQTLFGETAAIFVSIAVIISILSALNGSILAGPRVYFAMAQDGLFFRRVADVHPRFRTPSYALLLQAVWSCILTLSGTFERIITFVMFVSILFWIGTAASIFTLRKKYPDVRRTYKTWGYPVVPLLFIVGSSGILINTLIEKPAESLAGIGLTIIGIPVYYHWRKIRNDESRNTKGSFRR